MKVANSMHSYRADLTAEPYSLTTEADSAIRAKDWTFPNGETLTHVKITLPGGGTSVHLAIDQDGTIVAQADGHREKTAFTHLKSILARKGWAV